MFNSNSILIVLLALLISFLFATACKDEPIPDLPTIIDKLNSLDGITFAELVSNNPGVRRFQIDIDQPMDHDNLYGQWFTQRMYLHHVDEAQPMILWTDGYNVSQWNRSEWAPILNGNCLMVEHRYFDDSRPDPPDLQYLTIIQAAADHHRIVIKFKEIYTGPWMNSGGSKSGLTAIYHKRFYPDDVMATVAYGAPFMFSTADERFPPFLSGIGSDEDDQKVHTFQRLVLERRESLLPLFEEWFPQNGYTLAWDAEQMLEGKVIEYESEFWENKPCEPNEIPDYNATDQEILDHLNDFLGFEDSSEEGAIQGIPSIYQHWTEIGRPAIDTSHIDDLLRTELFDYKKAFRELLGVELIYNPASMYDINNWVITQGSNITFIYGGSDPWTAAAVELQGLTNALKIIIPGSDHAHLSINNLSQANRDLVISTLEQWLGIEIE